MRRNFAGEATSGTKIVARTPRFGGVGDRRAVVATGGGDDPGGRDVSQEQAGERAARLE
jgi:hypothetical protein